MNKDILISFIKEYLKIDVDDTTIDKFCVYFNELKEWNEKFNLTAIRDNQGIIEKHFIDSIFPAKFLDFNSKSLCDLGTGAGFPGLPLAILFPTLDVTLVESNNKKVKFLNHMVEILNLNNVIVLNKRAEDLVELKNKFDYVSARAMIRLNILLELAIPLCKVDGHLLAFKLSNNEKEIKEASHAFKELNAKIEEVYTYSLPISGDARDLIYIKKIKETKKKYPRLFTKISSSPL